MTPQPQDDFQKGRDAFLADDDHLYVGASDEWKEGYREQWYSHNAKRFENDNSGHLEEEAWEEHYRYEIEPFEKAFKHPEPSGVTARNTMLGVSLVLMVGSLGTAATWIFHYELMAAVGRLFQ